MTAPLTLPLKRIAADEPEMLFAEARRRRRARRVRLSLLAFALLGAGGGFYGIYGGGGSAHLPTVPQIEAAVAAQLTRSHDILLHETAVRSRGAAMVSFTNFGTPIFGMRSDLWIDLRTGNETSVGFNAAGRRTLSSATTFAPDTRQPNVAALTTTLVDYEGRTWSRQLSHEPLAVIRRRSPGNPFVGDLHFRLLGRDTVDGQRAFHLRADYPPRSAPKVCAGSACRVLDVPTSMDIWISATDSRVIRVQAMSNATPVATTDYHWLPRTAANLAKLGVSVPRGYTHQVHGNTVVLPSKLAVRPTAPLQTTSDRGISVTVGANGVAVFNSTHASAVARRTLAGGNNSYTCFKTKTNDDFTTVVSGARQGAFAAQVAFRLQTRTPFDGCELSTGYGQRWPAKFGGHDPVELAFTPAGKRYFADRAAARELALFVRSRKVHEIRREPAAAVGDALATTYKHGVVRINGQAPASPGEIGYTITSAGVTFSDRSATGRTFSVQVEHGKITRQNVKPLGYVF